MTSIQNHKENIKEFLKDINEKIDNELILERQKILGFTTSEASTELFEILLHKKNLVTPGFHVNHRFFASKKIARDKFDFEFPNREKILDHLVKQEEYREKLCYGKTKEKKLVEKALKNFFNFKKIIERGIGENIG